MIERSPKACLGERHQKDGIVFTLKRAGSFPSDIYEESPFCPKNILCDGYCDGCEIDFSKLSIEERQFLRLLYDGGEVRTDNRLQMMGIVSLAQKDGIEGLAKMFPTINEEFEEKKTLQELPSLWATETPAQQVKNKDPMGKNTRY